MISAGKLDRRIALQRYMETRDDFNNPVLTWAALATVSASKEDIRDSERMAAQETGSEITTRFQIRWSTAVADLNTKDRLEFPIDSGRYFNIVAVKEIGRREGIEISAAARADDGPSEGGG